MIPVIEVSNISKSYKVKCEAKGTFAILKNLFAPKYSVVQAVKNISFSINQGEKIGFIGPNGAGKSTTIKMLSGILQPSDGSIRILGYTAETQREMIVKEIGVIFGQRSQLWASLPVIDSYKILGKIYDVETSLLESRISYFAERFLIADLLNKPVKNLSFGQRMRCEIIASLLHGPKILFLDEPTIGLDVDAKNIIRSVIKEFSDELNITLILTSHDTTDIESICDRTIVINSGEIVLDASLDTLKKKFVQHKVISFYTDRKDLDFTNVDGVDSIIADSGHYTLIVKACKKVIQNVLQGIVLQCEPQDLLVEAESLEETISKIYAKGVC